MNNYSKPAEYVKSAVLLGICQFLYRTEPVSGTILSGILLVILGDKFCTLPGEYVKISLFTFKRDIVQTALRLLISLGIIWIIVGRNYTNSLPPEYTVSWNILGVISGVLLAAANDRQGNIFIRSGSIMSIVLFSLPVIFFSIPRSWGELGLWILILGNNFLGSGIYSLWKFTGETRK